MFDYISELQCVERVFVTNYEATTTYTGVYTQLKLKFSRNKIVK